MIGIICDSGTDVPESVKKDPRVQVVPLKIIIAEKEYNDNEPGLEAKILETQKTGIVKTSLPAIEDVFNSFEKLIKKGYKKIIGINISSNLSGTHNLFKIAAKSINEKYKDIPIQLFDSLSVSGGAGLIVLKALKYVEDKLSFEEVKSKISALIPKKCKVMFVIPTLKHLKEGGRIGKVSASIGELLKIKPIISVGEDGIYYTLAKAQGMKNAVRKMIEEFKKDVSERKIETAALYHSGNEAPIQELLASISSEVKLSRISLLEGKISDSMLVHTGEHLIGLAYLTE